MKQQKTNGHSISSLFSLLLFGIFALFLMLMLLFSARVYQNTMEQTDSDTDFGTAVTYLTTKFRQHDQTDGIFTGTLDGTPALCFRDHIKDKDYITYIYLKDENLMELFTASDSQANSSAGTAIAALSDFQTEKMEHGFYRITLKSTAGISSRFLLHITAADAAQPTVKKEASHEKITAKLWKQPFSHGDDPGTSVPVPLLCNLHSDLCGSKVKQDQAEQLNQIQTLTTSVGEALEGTDGSADEILELIPDGVQEDPEINWYYDNAWKICPRDSAVYVMTFTPDTSSPEKSGTLTSAGLLITQSFTRFPSAFLPVISERRIRNETKTLFFCNCWNPFPVSDFFCSGTFCSGSAYPRKLQKQPEHSKTFSGADGEILQSLLQCHRNRITDPKLGRQVCRRICK